MSAFDKPDARPSVLLVDTRPAEGGIHDAIDQARIIPVGAVEVRDPRPEIVARFVSGQSIKDLSDFYGQPRAYIELVIRGGIIQIMRPQL